MVFQIVLLFTKLATLLLKPKLSAVKKMRINDIKESLTKWKFSTIFVTISRIRISLSPIKKSIKACHVRIINQSYGTYKKRRPFDK